MIGRPPTFSRGLGVSSVRGRRRSPRPPAISTASAGIADFMRLTSITPVSLPSQVTGRRLILLSCAFATVLYLSCGDASAGREMKFRKAISLTGSSVVCPAIMARRMSPSVTLPMRRLSASTAKSVIESPLSRLSATRVSLIVALPLIICRSGRVAPQPLEGGVSVPFISPVRLRG